MMIKTQLTADKVAITLSLACVVHCFFVPSFIILSSGFLALALDNEFVHKFIVLVAVPVSLFSLTVGYRNHKALSFLLMGILGLLMLTAAVALGADALGELGEKGFTLLGSMLVAYAHFRNYQTCRNEDCSCHDE
tara:strand:- start:1263 stop:1667 length:405 start_codon:yes stop_codon:yes gene_type:complete